MTAHEPAVAKVNQMTSLSGQPNRFSFYMETNEKTTQVRPRNTISHRLKAIIVSSGCSCGIGGERIYAVLESLIEGCLTRPLANFGRLAC
jgi:hypothetical protein